MNKRGEGHVYDYVECLEFSIGEDMGITAEYAADLLGVKTKRRTNEICFRRVWFWQMLYDKFDKLSLRKLGEITGGHNHATVLKGVREARAKEVWLIPYEKEVAAVIERVKYM